MLDLRSLTAPLLSRFANPPRRVPDGPRPARPRGPDLRGADLRGRDLVGAHLEGADLRDADLREADLRGADLLGARLDRSDLRATRLDMTRIVEIAIPAELPLDVVNQIRDHDFRRVMTRLVPPDARGAMPCPYRRSPLRPLLFEWGSRTWRGGRDWTPPGTAWTLEEIIAATLDELGCRHDLTRPLRASPRREGGDAGACG